MQKLNLSAPGAVGARLSGLRGPAGPAGPPGPTGPVVAGTTIRRQFLFTDPDVARPAVSDALDWLGATATPPTNAIEGDTWTRRTASV